MHKDELLQLIEYYGAACHSQGWCLARCDRPGEEVAQEQVKIFHQEIATQIHKLYEERQP